MENERIEKEEIREENVGNENSLPLEGNENEIKDKGIKGKGNKILVAAIVAAVAIVAGVLFYINTPGYQYHKALKTGYRFLTESEYEQAKLSFEEAIAIEPKGYSALLGLMDVASATGNDEMLMTNFEEILALAEEEPVLWETEGEKIVNMAVALSPQVENREKYLTVLEKIYEKNQSEKTKSALLDLIKELGDAQWLLSQYEESLEILKRAHELNPDDKDILAQLEQLIKDYATECKNNQKYEKGLELIDWLKELKKDSKLDDLRVAIEEAKKIDEKVQKMLENLNTQFDEENIKEIKEIMLSDAWEEEAKDIYRIFYSKSLLGKEPVSGKGTAIYNINGSIYVYYGSFMDGMRQGEGQWYYAGSDGTLVRYTLNWEKDMPNGSAICDKYTELTTRGPGGVELYKTDIRVVDTFECINGIYHGHFKRNAVEGKSYQLEYDIKYGYTTPLPDSQVPSDIKQYLKPGEAIVAYNTKLNEGSVWAFYSLSRNTVSGITTIPASYQVEEINLTF